MTDRAEVLAFVKHFDAWIAEKPESVLYPGPGDYSDLERMIDARVALGIRLSRKARRVLLDLGYVG